MSPPVPKGTEFTAKQSRVFLGAENYVESSEARSNAELSMDYVLDRFEQINSIEDYHERERAWEEWDREDEEAIKNRPPGRSLSDLTEEEIDNLKEGDIYLLAGTLEDAKALLKKQLKERLRREKE